MQQRVGLAQALMNDPELLILDEPTSALDPLARVAMRELLLEANRAGKTIFLSSHLLSEIEMICHRVAILDKGRLVKLGKTDELLVSRDRYEVVARGVPADSFEHSQVRRWDESSSRVPAASQRDALERVWSLGGEVLSVNPVRRTLEEVFVELTEQGGRRVRPVSLIAANFLREHRWPVLILFAWIVLGAAATGDFGRSRPVSEDVVFYCQQQAMYICVFSAFLGG